MTPDFHLTYSKNGENLVSRNALSGAISTSIVYDIHSSLFSSAVNMSFKEPVPRVAKQTALDIMMWFLKVPRNYVLVEIIKTIYTPLNSRFTSNPLVTNRFSHPYLLDESLFILGALGVFCFSFLYHFSMQVIKANSIIIPIWG